MKFSPPKLINNNIVIIDGIARSGKLLTGTIVSSFSNTEQFEMGRNFEDIGPGINFKKIDIGFAESFLKNYLNELIYNKYLSRNVNFRASDRTGVKNSQFFDLYKKRLKIKEGDKVIKLIKKEKRNIPFVTHDLLLSINSLNKLNLKYKMIYIFRNPFDLIVSWNARKLGKRLGKDQRMFTLMTEKNKKTFSWYNEITRKYEKYNNMETCANFVYHLIEKTIKNFKKLGKKRKKNIYITTYQKVTQNKNNEIKKIAKFLNSKLTKNTFSVIKKEKLHKKDKKKYHLNLNKRKKLIKSKISDKIYCKLIKQEKNFNLNTYNLDFSH